MFWDTATNHHCTVSIPCPLYAIGHVDHRIHSIRIHPCLESGHVVGGHINKTDRLLLSCWPRMPKLDSVLVFILALSGSSQFDFWDIAVVRKDEFDFGDGANCEECIGCIAHNARIASIRCSMEFFWVCVNWLQSLWVHHNLPIIDQVHNDRLTVWFMASLIKSKCK